MPVIKTIICTMPFRSSFKIAIVSFLEHSVRSVGGDTSLKCVYTVTTLCVGGGVTSDIFFVAGYICRCPYNLSTTTTVLFNDFRLQKAFEVNCVSLVKKKGFPVFFTTDKNSFPLIFVVQ